MADWQFTTESECLLLKVQVGRGDAGDIMVARLTGESIPSTNPPLIKRRGYSVCVRGVIRYTPVNLAINLAFDSGVLGSDSPFGGQNMPDDQWSCEMLEDNTVYCCLTCQAGLRLNYIQIMANTTHSLNEETWVIPLGGPAVINGFSIPEFEIAHKMSGDMIIETNNLVVCATERIS